MTMSAENVARAQEMRDSGMSDSAIGRELGVGNKAIAYQLNPAAREKKAAYRDANRDKATAYAREYVAANLEEVRAKQRIYAETHREEDKASSAAYRAANPEKCRISKAASYQANRKKRLASVREYYRNHVGESAAWAAKRRALKAGALVGATIAQRAEIKAIYKRAKEDPKVRCYLCGDLIKMGERQVDHIMPLSKGGTHRPSNLAVACASCNLKKHDKLPEEAGILL